MSDDDQSITTADGVQVGKRFDREEFASPVVAFRITSRRPQPVTVTVVETIPSDIDPEDIGFHHEYGAKDWTIREDELVFERSIAPDEEYVTLYRLPELADEAVDEIPTAPTIKTDPPLEEGEISDEGVLTRGAGAAEGFGTPLAKDNATAENKPTLDLEIPRETAATDGGSHGSGSTDLSSMRNQSDEVTTEDDQSNESLVAALATELEEGDVADEEIDRLRSALHESETRSGSLVARVEKLQRDVGEVIAYTDALQEFLDENGTGEQMIAEFRDEVSNLQAEMQDLQTEVAEMGETMTRTESRVDDLEADVSDQFDDVDAELASLHDEVESIEEWRQELASLVGE